MNQISMLIREGARVLLHIICFELFKLAGAADGIHVHRGFAEGARQHLDAIVSTIQSANTAAEKPLPVWISGHSLGGAYANCLMLQLLERKSTARLFTAGTTTGFALLPQTGQCRQPYECCHAARAVVSPALVAPAYCLQRMVSTSSNRNQIQPYVEAMACRWWVGDFRSTDGDPSG